MEAKNIFDSSRKNSSAKPKHQSRSYQCNICKRAFFYQTSLRTHQNTCKSKRLFEHCRKISIAERKKLRSTDQLLDVVYKSCSASQIERQKAVSVKHLAPIKGIPHIRRKLINCFNCGQKFKYPCSFATHATHCISKTHIWPTAFWTPMEAPIQRLIQLFERAVWTKIWHRQV